MRSEIAINNEEIRKTWETDHNQKKKKAEINNRTWSLFFFKRFKSFLKNVVKPIILIFFIRRENERKSTKREKKWKNIVLSWMCVCNKDTYGSFFLWVKELNKCIH